MILKSPKKKRVSLKGAVQINRNSYFVYTDDRGNTFLKNGNDEHLQKSVVKNMIALNPAIKGLLKKYKINVTVRREFGSNIDAACGQLRAKEVEK